MHGSDECTTLVSAWEGLPDGDPSTLNYDPYMDPVSIWTIGYGRALRDAATGKYLVGMKDRKAAYAQYPGGITRAEAVRMLAIDMKKEEAPVTALVKTAGATQAQFDAFVSFNFNTGALGSSTLLKRHNEAAPAGGLASDAAIKALAGAVRDKTMGTPRTILQGFAAWSFGKGVFYPGLFCRRLAEWTLYTGASGKAANEFGAHVRSVLAK